MNLVVLFCECLKSQIITNLLICLYHSIIIFVYMKKNISKVKVKEIPSSGNLNNAKSEEVSQLLINATLFFSAIILYGFTATFNFGQDDNYINTALNNIENTPAGLITVFKTTFAVTDYRPISILSFWIERWFTGELKPGVSHFLNVVLFGFLLTRIYRFIIVGRFYKDTKQLSILAFLTAIIFLVHPNHVSVVANIKSRDSLLSMIFGLMSAIQFIKMADEKKWWRIILVLMFMAFGFLSKMDCYMFMIAPLLVFFLFREIKIKRILLLLFFSLVLYNVIFGLKESLLSNTINHGDVKPILMDITRSPLVGNDTLLNRISMSFITMLYYLKFLVIPWGYYFYFGYNQIPLLPLFHPINFLTVFIYLSIAFCCLWIFKKNRIYLFSFIFFLLAIAYASNIPIIVAGIIMDRYNFIPSLGFCLASAAIIVDFTKPSSLITVFRNMWVVSILLVYTGFTVYRTTAWKDSLTLYNRDISHLDKSVHANRTISVTYIQKMLFEDQDNSLKDQHMKLAEQYADKALAVSDKSPDVFEAKGICEIYNGNNFGAIQYLKKSMVLDSNYYSAINYIGVAYRNLQMTDSAYYYFNYVMQREPVYGYSADNLIELLIKNNRFKEADSLINLLNIKFPNNQALKNKESELNKSGWKNQLLFPSVK